MVTRIQKIMAEKHLTAQEFVNLTGVQRSTVSHILSGRNKPSLDFVIKVLNRFPDINAEWLINGLGKMYKTPNNHLFIPPTKKQEIHLPNLDNQQSARSLMPENSNTIKKIANIIVIYSNGTFDTFVN